LVGAFQDGLEGVGRQKKQQKYGHEFRVTNRKPLVSVTNDLCR
jgi:hypothetical protein